MPLALLAALLPVALAGPADAQSGAGAPGSAPKPVALDRLLQLPQSYETEVERRGGASQSEWRARFDSARERLAAAEAELAKSQDALANAFGESDAWGFTPPGLPEGAASEVRDAHRLREEVRRRRVELERSRIRLRELDVEANLSGVPADWRGTRTDANPGNETVTAPRQAASPP